MVAIIQLHHQSIFFASTILLSFYTNSLTGGLIGPVDSVQKEKQHFLSYCILIFTVFLSFGFSDVSTHPLTHLVNTLIVCSIFIIMSSLSRWYFYTCFVLVGLVLIMESFRNYYQTNVPYNQTLLYIQYIIMVFVLFITIIGVIRARTKTTGSVTDI